MKKIIAALAATTTLALAVPATAELSAADYGIVADDLNLIGLTPVQPIDGPYVVPDLMWPPIEVPPIEFVGGCAVVLVPAGYICIDDPNVPSGIKIVKVFDPFEPYDPLKIPFWVDPPEQFGGYDLGASPQFIQMGPQPIMGYN